MADHDDNYTDVDPPPPDDDPLRASESPGSAGARSNADALRSVIELGPGTEVGGYIIDGELGRGGMGVVYAATHPVIGKRAAIKVLRPSLSKNPIAVERFIQEARAVNQIGHPSIVDIFAFDRLPDGRAYLVMDLLVGESLRRRLRRGPLHLSEGASVIDEVSSALMAAHDKGFVHRDLKPDNVYLVPRDGRWPEVKLLDFGLAKLLQRGESAVQTKTGVLLGTPDYMSPEQARGKEIDHRTDIYALGVLTFEILTGKRPFPKYETPLETLQAHAEKAPLSLGDEVPTLPQEIIQLAEAMLAKDPDHRPSLSAVRAVIKRLRSNTIIPTMSVASLELSLPASMPKSSASELSLTAMRLGAEPVVPSAQSLVESLPSVPSAGLDARNSVPTAPGTVRASAEQSGAKWPATTVPGATPDALRPPSNPGIASRHPSQPPHSADNADPRYMTQPPMSDPRRRPSQPPDPISGPVVVDIRQGPPIVDQRHASHPPSSSQPLVNAVADARFSSQPPSGSARFPSTVPGTITNRSPTNPPLPAEPSAAGSQPPTAGLRPAGSPHASTTFGVAPPFKVSTSKKQPVAKPSSRLWIIAIAIIVAAAAAVVLTQML